MVEWVDFVEVPDFGEYRQGYEARAARRRRRLPAWLARFTGHRRAWHVAGAAVLLACVLVADGAARSTPGLPAEYVYAAGAHCPVGVRCSDLGPARADMWDAYYIAFPGSGSMYMTGSDIWYEPSSGVVFYQQLDAVSVPDWGLKITLAEKRIDQNTKLSFGPTVDFMPRHATPLQQHRFVLITARRGPWLITALVSGPLDQTLPIGNALDWARIAPVPQ